MGIIEWAHRRDTFLQNLVFGWLKAGSTWRVPQIPVVHAALLAERRFRKGPLRLFASKVYYEPLLRMQCVSVGSGLLLHEDMPKILGNLAVYLGNRVTLSGAQVWIAGGSGARKELRIGDHCSVGHGVELTVGDGIRIGSHVRIANHAALNGYDGHPIDPLARARDDAPASDRSGVIEVLDYAWIGDGAVILKGVSIGRGAIVAPRAVVTHDVPELAMVAGIPARVIKTLPAPDGW